MSIKRFMQAIRRLPADAPKHYPGKWFRTQKEHWLRWLSEYDSPGAYDRAVGIKRNAAFAYNHIVESKMLLWLIEAAGVDRAKLAAARRASARAETMAAKSGAVRNSVPWEIVEALLHSRVVKRGGATTATPQLVTGSRGGRELA